MERTRNFKQKGNNGNNKVLKLKNTFYGRRNSRHSFQKHTDAKLEVCVLSQSKLDPLLFVGDKVICIVYVDDLIYGKIRLGYS